MGQEFHYNLYVQSHVDTGLCNSSSVSVLWTPLGIKNINLGPTKNSPCDFKQMSLVFPFFFFLFGKNPDDSLYTI